MAIGILPLPIDILFSRFSLNNDDLIDVTPLVISGKFRFNLKCSNSSRKRRPISTSGQSHSSSVSSFTSSPLSFGNKSNRLLTCFWPWLYLSPSKSSSLSFKYLAKSKGLLFVSSVFSGEVSTLLTTAVAIRLKVIGKL